MTQILVHLHFCHRSRKYYPYFLFQTTYDAAAELRKDFVCTVYRYLKSMAMMAMQCFIERERNHATQDKHFNPV